MKFCLGFGFKKELGRAANFQSGQGGEGDLGLELHDLILPDFDECEKIIANMKNRNQGIFNIIGGERK